MMHRERYETAHETPDGRRIWAEYMPLERVQMCRAWTFKAGQDYRAIRFVVLDEGRVVASARTATTLMAGPVV